MLTLQSTAYSISSMFGTTLQGAKGNGVGTPKGLGCWIMLRGQQ